MYVLPAREGTLVRFPGQPSVTLPPEGAEVSDHDSYWQRRVADGDVVVRPQVQPESQAPARARSGRGRAETEE